MNKEKVKNTFNLYNNTETYNRHKEENKSNLNFVNVNLDDYVKKSDIPTIQDNGKFILKSEVEKNYVHKDSLKWIKIWEGFEKKTVTTICKLPQEFNELLFTYAYDNDGVKSFVFSLHITKEMWQQQLNDKTMTYDSAMFCVPFGVNIYIVKATMEYAMFDKFEHDNLVAIGVYYR